MTNHLFAAQKTYFKVSLRHLLFGRSILFSIYFSIRQVAQNYKHVHPFSQCNIVAAAFSCGYLVGDSDRLKTGIVVLRFPVFHLLLISTWCAHLCGESFKTDPSILPSREGLAQVHVTTPAALWRAECWPSFALGLAVETLFGEITVDLSTKIFILAKELYVFQAYSAVIYSISTYAK